MVMKPRDGRSSEGLYRVRTAEDLQTAVREIRLWGGEDRYLVQPLIEGNVITVDVVRSADGACIAVPREELRRTHNGAGIAVRVFRDPLVEREAHEQISCVSNDSHDDKLYQSGIGRIESKADVLSCGSVGGQAGKESLYSGKTAFFGDYTERKSDSKITYPYRDAVSHSFKKDVFSCLHLNTSPVVVLL